MVFKKILNNLAKVFKKLKLSYMLVGGFAVGCWGYPRQSMDIDMVIDLKPEEGKKFIKEAKKAGFKIHQQEVKTILKIGNRFVMEADDFRIDCWLPKSIFEKETLKNRKKKKLFGTNVSIISAEDLILSKLLVGRARDIEDIKTIFIRQGAKLDKAYINKNAKRLNVYSLLKKVKV